MPRSPLVAQTRSWSAAATGPLQPLERLSAYLLKACHFDPQVNRTYAGMVAHFGSAVLPTRPRRPRDKAKASYCILS
jgi:hypothetical protein